MSNLTEVKPVRPKSTHRHPHRHLNKKNLKLKVSASAPVRLVDEEEKEDYMKTFQVLTLSCDSYRNELQKQEGTYLT